MIIKIDGIGVKVPNAEGFFIKVVNDMRSGGPKILNAVERNALNGISRGVIVVVRLLVVVGFLSVVGVLGVVRLIINLGRSIWCGGGDIVLRNGILLSRVLSRGLGSRLILLGSKLSSTKATRLGC